MLNDSNPRNQSLGVHSVMRINHMHGFHGLSGSCTPDDSLFRFRFERVSFVVRNQLHSLQRFQADLLVRRLKVILQQLQRRRSSQLVWNRGVTQSCFVGDEMSKRGRASRGEAFPGRRVIPFGRHREWLAPFTYRLDSFSL